MKRIVIVMSLLVVSSLAQADALKKLRVASDSRHFETINGEPVFLLADTAWTILTQPTTSQIAYTTTTIAQGFNATQVDLTGYYFVDQGTIPFTGSDSNNRNEAYWSGVDSFITRCSTSGLYVIATIAWPYHLPYDSNTNAKISTFATWLGNRYQSYDNIVWILAGEYSANFGYVQNGITAAEKAKFDVTGASLTLAGATQLKTIHPGVHISTSDFNASTWLDFFVSQSGHASDNHNRQAGSLPETYEMTLTNYGTSPTRPTFDAEIVYDGRYDNTQVQTGPAAPALRAVDVRRKAYWSTLSGAAGVTYGHEALECTNVPIAGGLPNCLVSFNGVTSSTALPHYLVAMSSPSRTQMVNLKNLMLSKPLTNRVADTTVLTSTGGVDLTHRQCMRDSNNKWAWVYTPGTGTLTVDSTKLADKYTARWFDPTNGAYLSVAGIFINSGTQSFTHPGSNSVGDSDWILTLEVVRSPARGTAQFTGRIN